MDLSVGARVTSSLQLVRPLAEGAMGSVWVAQHLALDLRVAIKFVRADVAHNDPTSLDRMSREAIATTRIKSPHVVQIFDHGSTPDGSAFIVMELLEGETLAKRLSRVGPCSIAEALAIAEQTAGVLDKAHALGIVHRDIKPENLFLTQMAGRIVVKVLDFGLAKLPQAPELTLTGAVLGTPAYMSPEQLRTSKYSSELADLWALAVTLYKALTGRLPFEAATPAAVAVLVFQEAFAPVRQYRAGLSPLLEAWFARALAKNPSERFATAYEFSRTFTEALGGDVASAAEGENLFRSCLEEDELLAMVEGRLSDREMTRIEQHLDACRVCCEFVGAALATESAEPLPRQPPRLSSGSLPPGAIVAHRYRVERWLHGRDSRDLYDATDLLLQERVALETLPITLDDHALCRLLRDVRLACRVQHPNVCSTYAVHVYEEQLGTCHHVLTSEFIEGETLRERLRRVGPLPLDAGLTLIRELLEGLRAVHAAGLLHRDLRPEKVRLRSADAGQEQAVILHCCYGALVQPPPASEVRYCAPERLDDSYAGPQTDLFALGVIAHEIPPTGALRATAFPDALVELLTACLDPRWQARYAHASDALQALSRV